MAKYINPYTDFGFKKLFGEAELARLSVEQRAIYEENLIQYWGMKSAIETAVEEAVGTAVEERAIEIAKSLLVTLLSNEEIAKHTGLAVEQIEQLRNKTK